MATLAELYMFEDVIEKAVSLWLESNGINDPAKQQDSRIDDNGSVITLKTPRVEVKALFSGGFKREHYYVNQSTNERWLDIGDGITYVKIVTRRPGDRSGGQESPSHSHLRGLCRGLMQKVQSISSKMTCHKIEKMIETQSSITVEADKNHDVSALSFETSLRILPQHFPTS